MKRLSSLVALLSSLAAAGAGAGTIVPLAAATEPSSAGESTPGALHWHRGESGAFLSVGTPERGREVVSDPFALHRVPLSAIEPPDYSVEMGEGVTVSNGWFVLFSNRADTSEVVTRSVALSPAAGWTLRRCEVENARHSAATASVSGGRIVVSCTTATLAPGVQTYTDCAFRILAVRASEAAARDAPEDLTQGDYYYTDTVGDISLGTLREWVNAKCAGRLADSWSRYPATGRVWLDGRPLVFDAFGRFSTAIESGANTADTLAIVAGGRRAVEIVSEVSTTNSAFRVVDFALADDTVSMWVAAIGTNVAVQAVTNLLDSPLSWTDEQGVEVDYSPVVRDGVDCYHVTFPRVSGPRFWRARTTIGASTEAAVRVNVPLILTSPDGSRWRLKVADDGSLSTEAAQ